MALSDYNPVLQWYADAITDLDEPTGTTKSNPGSTGNPAIAGSGDQYADFDKSGNGDAVQFSYTPEVLDVGTGDITIVCKMRIDVEASGDVMWSLYDGSGSSGSAHGLTCYIGSTTNDTIRFWTPPRAQTSWFTESGNTAYVLGQDLIIAFKRASGVTTTWLDNDASGNMAESTHGSNTNATGAITEGGVFTFGAKDDGSTPFDGRIYWLVAFDTAIADADLQLSDWATESNLTSAWLGGTSTGTGTPAAQAATASGTGEITNTGTGTPAAQAATVAGTGSVGDAVQVILTAANSRELRDENGAVVASLSGIVWEWYDDPTSTAGTPTDTGTVSTDANGEATINVLGSSLTNGQFGQLILYHPTDTDIRGTYRIPVVN